MPEQPPNGERLDAWHDSEVLDRSSVLAHLFDFYIASHPVVANDGDLHALVERAGELLGAIYQRAGTLLEERSVEER